MVLWQELGATLWAIALLSYHAVLGWRPLLIALGVFSLTALLNQLRTLVAHLWENDGAAMTVTAQYLNSVNVPPPAGSRRCGRPLACGITRCIICYRACLPLLNEAHRRLIGHLGEGSTYHGANYGGMWPLLGKIARSTMVRR